MKNTGEWRLAAVLCALAAFGSPLGAESATDESAVLPAGAALAVDRAAAADDALFPGFATMADGSQDGGISAASGQSPAGASKLRFDLSSSGLAAPSCNSGNSRPFLWAGGFSISASFEYCFGSVPLRLQSGYYYIGRSETDSSTLFLYRGFSGMRTALESGYRFSIGGLSLELLAGGAVSISEYLNTSLVSAYWSIVAEPRLLIPVTVGGIAICAGIPIEYMFRGSTRSYAAGISAGVSIPLGKGAAK